MKLPRILSVALVITLAACSPANNEVRRVFDGAMRGYTPYPVPGVSRYEVRAYEVVQSSGDIIAVRITFASKGGRDIVQTKKFKLSGGRLKSVDRDDIDAHIQGTLEELSTWVRLKAMDEGGPLTWEKIVKSVGPDIMKQFGAEASVNGEDYSKTGFTTGRFGNVKLTIKDADFHTIEYGKIE